MTKLKKPLKNENLRYNEYYGLQDDLDNLYKRSQQNKIFYTIYDKIIDENNIMKAFRTIKRNHGSKTKGCNGHNINYLENFTKEGLIKMVRKRLKDYKPEPVKRRFIPKPNGKQRPLGIPTIEDRLIQQCILQILEPICEAKFHNSSFGFRPLRGTHHAIARCEHLVNHTYNHWVVDIDLKGFFDNVNHSKLMKQIWSLGIRDKQVLCIIRKMLKAEILGEGTPTCGVPQGGILSPLLANIALNELDWWISNQWETKKLRYYYISKSSRSRALRKTKLKPCYIVRYADDFKLFTNSRENAIKLKIATEKWLKERLGLEINQEKSKITNLRKNGSDFLGFRFRADQKKTSPRGYVCKVKITPKRVDKIIKVYRYKLKDLRLNPSAKKVISLNSYTLGTHNYFKSATNVTVDFHRIKHRIIYKFKNLLKRKIFVLKGVSNGVIESFYKGYNKPLVRCCDVTVYPIEYIHFKLTTQFNPAMTPYTEIGRRMVHKVLEGISAKELDELRKGNFGNRSIEYIDNRVSKFVGQKGKCYITGIRLRTYEVHCHHIIPRRLNGSDRYDNLVIVSKEVHNLIHSVNTEKVRAMTKNWTCKAKLKFNKLRKQAKLEEIIFN